ncbi:MAG: transketolase [Flavobacteriales bacterium]|nr:transketolase [Flavobacteriales bacterium]MCX7650122.1 transketolase [Flavobacteriales bacterium]MDW8431222.1 transketolase [Flavobacteriales bacterium]
MVFTDNELEILCRQVRRDIIRMTWRAASGHPGGSLGCTELLVALYFRIMEYRPHPFNMDGVGEDIFFLSNGHISPVWYSVLARSGHFPLSELATFRHINSRLQGHPTTHEGLPGVRVASGSLGQGLSVAVGAALAKRLNGDQRFVFSLHGDGEIQEGQIWEAAMAAPKFQLNRLISIIDLNGRQIDGNTDDVMPLGDLRAKWESFGWHVAAMNGNRLPEVIATLQRLMHEAEDRRQPTMVLMVTEMGYGVDFMMGTHKWHGVAPNRDEALRALSQLPPTPFGDFEPLDLV